MQEGTNVAEDRMSGATEVQGGTNVAGDRMSGATEVQEGTNVAEDRMSGATATDEVDYEALISEKYQGIRPAAGYPATPDHTEKDAIWEILDVAAKTGMTLTESKAMLPTAAVSGLYLGHPEACYFSVGKLGRDQIEDYAQRKEIELHDIERWLSSNLAYNPDDHKV